LPASPLLPFFSLFFFVALSLTPSLSFGLHNNPCS
jgi:hypothetical protein